MTRALELEDLYEFRLPSDPQLSPDGRTLAFTITTSDRDDDSDHQAIWAFDVETGALRQLTNGTHDSQPRWSPDGKQLAFLSVKTDSGAAPQLNLLPLDGGEPRVVTELPLGAGEPAWSPDGKRIAFVAGVDIDHEPGTPPEQIASEPIVVTRLDHKIDGAGRLRGLRQHLFVLDADGGEARQITRGDYFASSPVWSPDSGTIAFASSMGEDRDLAMASVVYVIGADGGTPQRITPEKGLLAAVDWSPDGSTLLLAGMEKLAVGHNRLFTVDASGDHEPRELCNSFDRNVMTGAPGYPGALPRFVDDGKRVIFCARERGRVHVFSVAATGGAPEPAVDGDLIVSGMSEADGALAFVAGSWESSGELFLRGASGSVKKLTSLFADALPDVELATGEERWFTAADGTRIEGWVIKKGAGGASGEPGPLLLDIHGGPHNAWGPAFDPYHLYHQRLADAGWTIVCINPRGSDGYGEEFWSALLRDGWGRADQQDFLAAIDELVADGTADPRRVAVTGYSYGGQMTCVLTADHPDRFAAAVAGGCVSNAVSVSGTSDFGWLIRSLELDRPSYDDDTLDRLSAINRVTNVTTPTLLLHGANDERCPVGPAEEWFTALRSRRIPTEMVLYPGGGHLFILSGQPSHRIDYSARVEEWVTRYAGEHPAEVAPTRTNALRGFQSWFESALRRHAVPGASIAVLREGELQTAAAGVLDIDTGVEVTADSLFQIGSITKTYTTTLVMQLVDEGLIDLDAPIVKVLPEFKVADPDVTQQVTMRHLLTHTSGIQGDHFPDTGRGDDAIERYVSTCAELDQSHPLGATMSYCNTGFVVAGRVIEKVTGRSWIEALHERVLDPLDMNASVVYPEDALRFRVAYGHTVGDSGAVSRASQWMLPWSCGPAGLISATATDVVAFARMHLDDGKAPNGKQVLSPGSVKSMQIEQIAVPDPHSRGTYWGLGWILFDWDGRRLFGHDGGTLGQLAFLRILPDEDIAIALLTNSDKGGDLFREVYGELFGELAGIEVPEPPGPLAEKPSFDVSRYLGTFERVASRIEISERDGQLIMTDIVTGPLAELLPKAEQDYVLHPAGEDLFVYRPKGTKTWMTLVFYELEDGTQCLHTGGRATPRVT